MIVVAATVTVTGVQLAAPEAPAKPEAPEAPAAPLAAAPEDPLAPLDTATTVMYLVEVLVPKTVVVGPVELAAPLAVGELVAYSVCRC